ncbi:MAG: Mur ligase family protein, partial [Gemmatimonadales bacterium]
MQFLKRVRRRMLLSATWFWRRCMYRTTFIAVTGSVGKSTCKELIAAVLESRFPTVRTRGNRNFFRGVTRTVLSVRPWHKYAVVEVGLDGPGQMESFARA